MAVTAIKRLRPDAVTSVELIWPVPPPVLPLAPARPGVLSTPLATPSMQELTQIARAIAAETTFRDAALRLQRELCRLTRAAEALCVAFDWPRRLATTAAGAVASEQVKELVAQVAGGGRRTVIGNALLAPIGPAPARAVIALRRATPFRTPEIELVAGLAAGVAGAFERLLR